MIMRILLTSAFLLATTGQAQAFHQVESFTQSPDSGGGAGNYFTGSPRAKGYDCEICHVATEGKISIAIDSSLKSGSYKSGLIYTISLRLEGEHKGLESAFNPNTFTAAITDEKGEPIGTFAGSGINLEKDFTIAIAQGFGNGETEWQFDWWAPSEAVPATLYIAMLDGDGASDPENRFIDPLNDDVATLEIHLCPDGEVCTPAIVPEPETSPAGCSTSTSTGSLFLIGIALMLLGLRRRRSNEA